MRFASTRYEGHSQRMLAVLTAVALLVSMMVVYADPARAHHPEITSEVACEPGVTVSWTATSWNPGALNGTHDNVLVEIEVDGGSRIEVGSGEFSDANGYEFSGSFDASGYVGSEVVVIATAVGPWGSGTGGDESRSADPLTVVDDCNQTQTVSISSELGCTIEWVGDGFTMHVTVDFDVSDASGVESIEVTPVDDGDSSIVGGTWTGEPLVLLPWNYDWVAQMADGFVGDPPSGVIRITEEFFLAECACPTGTIDLTDTGPLLANDVTQDSKIGQPASPVSIPAGMYEIYLSSFDEHGEHPDQNQPLEIWALADAEDGLGSFESPPTSDMPSNLDFQSYHVTASTGPVFVPEFASADLWTVHAAAPNSINSINPVCAKLVSQTEPVDVEVTSAACEVDDQGQPVGSVSIGVDPDSGATVTVYSDAGMTVEVVSTTSGGDFALPPGTYYWAAEASVGFELTGESSGSFTIDPCDVTVAVGGECLVDDDGMGFGQLTVEIDTPGAATVVVKNESDVVVATLTQSGTVDVPEDATYTWEATAADGFSLTGESSGTIDVEACTTTDQRIIIVKEVLDGSDTSQSFDFEASYDSEGFSLADGESNDSGSLDPGTYSVSEDVPDGWSLISATCDDGSEVDAIGLEAGETVTCTFVNLEDQVSPSIVVTVNAACDPNDDTQAIITADIPVPDGATIVVTDSDGEVVATFTESGSVTVPDNATYTWEATAGEGFEFAPGSETSGTLTIEDCTDVLPFTGLDADVLIALAIVLVGGGALLLSTTRRRET